ncbi:MAG: DUF4105 domain-containing protein [Gammaproteobacteria bacterium]|nr:DUF4105 domain-containing protein [Gammaproteobacteria bacterium]
MNVDFFLSDQGQADARAELLASVRAFYLPLQGAEPDSHAQCRFPARLHWLSQQLDMSDLPRVNCNEFLHWQQKLNVKSVTLLFPSMFLNNPGSMFGHTFIRLDSPNKSPLLNYTLSFAAASDPEDGALAYVYKGLAGGYAGVFHLQPYYEMVQEYGDIEHRDIWEYPLNLTPEEVAQMVRHIWEVKTVHFDYFFLRENCAYRLLSLLDVARPGLAISRHAHPVYAIPADTVRSVSAAGLIRGAQYRPSQNSRIQQMVSQLEKPLRQQALTLLDQGVPVNHQQLQPYDARQQAQILVLAHEINQLKNSDNRELSHQLLSARSQLPVEASIFDFNEFRPEQSHLSARWSMQLGQLEQEAFIELGIRPSFHDLLDDPNGFIDGAAITVLEGSLRWYRHSEQIKLQNLTVFGLTSLSPVTDWSTPFSVDTEISYGRQPMPDGRLESVTRGAFALGYSWRNEALTAYAMAHSQLDYSRELDGHYGLYLGLKSGLLYQLAHSRMQLQWISAASVAGTDNHFQEGSLAYQYDLSKTQGLRLSYQRDELDGPSVSEWGIRWLHYF